MIVNGIDLPFDDVIIEDAEFISIPGERPDVVCAAFHSLRTGQTTRLFRAVDEAGWPTENCLAGLNPGQLPYENERTLVVSFVFNAEGAYLYRLVSLYLRMF